MTDQAVQVATQVGQGLGASAAQILESSHMLIGSVDQISEKILRYREEYGISYFVIVGEGCTPLAPVLARLASHR